MIITKPSFYDYMRQIEELDESNEIIEAILMEMPLPPVRFKNGGKDFSDQKHHVSSTIPVFMDEDDILYLYQFPSEFWMQANAYRYNHALFEVKKNPKFNDIQDISFTIPGKHKNVVIFPQRNTFAHKLLDKVERTVDVDHFRTSDKNDQNKAAYKQQFQQHGQNKVDMGGYIGADLSDPERSSRDPQLWASKGFMGPDVASVKRITTAWLDASSHGMLGDPSEDTDAHRNIKLHGGKNAKREVRPLNFAKLQKVAQEMKEAGAVPFNFKRNGSVSWSNVKVVNAKGQTNELHEYPLSSSTRTILPILMPGKAVDASSAAKYELNKDIHNNIPGVKLNDVANNFDNIVADQQEAKRILTDKSYKNGRERQALINKVKKLEPTIAFGKWCREQGTVPNADNIADLKIAFTQEMHNRHLDIGKKSKKYDAYDWNVHRFNRDRNPHDPMDVGMGNPLNLGGFKHSRLRNKTRGYGTFSPNRQSKSMIHGSEGEWEDHFKDMFGIGDHDQKVNTHLNKDELEQIEKEVVQYIHKVGKKMAQDPEVSEYLGIDPSEAEDVLSDPSKIRSLLSKKEILDSKGRIKSDAEDVPDILNKGYAELRATEKRFKELHSSVNEGYSKSDIAAGVETAISRIQSQPDLKAALEANKLWITMGAEHVVKRNIGESPFRHYLSNKNKKDLSALDKHKQILDIKQFVRSLGQEYTERIAQLKFGNEDSNATINTRRLRGMEKFKVQNNIEDDSNIGDPKDFGNSSNLSGDDKADALAQTRNPEQSRVSQRGEYEDEANAFVSAYFGAMEQSRFRKNRAESDSVGHQIGHNISTIYKQIQDYAKTAAAKAKAAADAGSKQLAIKNGEQGETVDATSQEKEMLQSINNSIALYDFFKQLFLRKKIGVPAGADKWAREKMMNVLKRHNLVSSDGEDFEAMAAAIRHTPADLPERRANAIMRGWEEELPDGLQEPQIKAEINKKIDAMAASANSSTDIDQKRIVDRLCVLNHRKPQFNTVNMAAVATGTAIPDVALPKKVRNALGNVIAKHKGVVPGFQQQLPMPIQTAPVPTKPVIAQAGADQMNPAVKAGGLGAFLRKKKETPPN